MVRTACSCYALVTDGDGLEVIRTVLGADREVERGFILCGEFKINNKMLKLRIFFTTEIICLLLQIE